MIANEVNRRTTRVPKLPFQVPIGVQPGGRPAAAIELSPEGVLAAATPAPGQPPVYAFEPLPVDALKPGLTEANVANSAALTAAIRAALGQVNPRVKAVTVVLPDPSVRVFVLDFDTFPTRLDEALPVLRFRLRKAVPFDVELSSVSFQILSEGSARLETQWKILAAIVPGPVLAEYEAAVRAAGYEPGVVLPASLAALCALESQEAVLAVNLGSQTLTTSIVAGSDVLLHRTIELPPTREAFAADVQRTIAVAAAFYEDKLHVQPRTLKYSGVLPAPEFAEIVNIDSGEPLLQVDELVPHPQTGMVSALRNSSVAGVTGVLAGTK